MPKLRFFIFFIFSFILCFKSYSQSNLERILNHEVDISINPNGSLKVIENITVYANNQQIQRGIVKELNNKKLNGNYRQQNYRVISAKINDQPSQFFIDYLQDYQRIRIGNPDVILKPGIYKFTLEYEAFNSLGFFENQDELYWNVTGNYSTFIVDKVVGTIRFPSYIDSNNVKIRGLVGPLGSNQELKSIFLNQNEVRFNYNQTLPPGSGVTVVIGFPKGIFPEEKAEEIVYIDTDPAQVIVALIALNLGSLLVFFYRGRRENRNADKIIKDSPVNFELPYSILPSEARYLYKQNYDEECLGSEILNLAINKHLKIEGSKSIIGNLFNFTPDYKIELISEKDKFTGLQKIIIESLFDSKKILKTKEEVDSEIIYQANLKYKKELSKSNLLDNGFGTHSIIKYLPFIIFFIVILGFTLKNDVNLFTFSIVAFILLTISRLVAFAIKNTKGSNLFLKVIFFGIAGIGLTTIILITDTAVKNYNPYYAILFFTSLIPYLLAEYLSPNYKLTQEGLNKMVLIEGFRKFAISQENYLQSVEENLPEKFNMYEKYLPYAIALDVDTQWSNKFKDAIEYGIIKMKDLEKLDYQYIENPNFLVKTIRRNNQIVTQRHNYRSFQNYSKGSSFSGFSSGGSSGGGGGSRGTSGW